MSFGSEAGTYEAGRPGYPTEPVAWMLEPVRHEGRALRVADIGAGTGKLTRVVVELGAEVVAIDPDPAMLAELRTQVHGVPTFVGSAERMPLPDASVDALLFGQAWHWVDVARGIDRGGARAAFRRGAGTRLEHPGRVGAVGAPPHRDHARQPRRGDDGRGRPAGRRAIRQGGGATWRWSRRMTREALFAMARSRSYIITAEPDDRAAIEAGSRRTLRRDRGGGRGIHRRAVRDSRVLAASGLRRWPAPAGLRTAARVDAARRDRAEDGDSAFGLDDVSAAGG